MSTETLEKPSVEESIELDVDLETTIPCVFGSEHPPATHRICHPIGSGVSCIVFACEDCTNDLISGLADMSRHAKVCHGFHRNNPRVDCTVCKTENILVDDYKIRSLK